jgi:hypothetical protein
VLKLYDGTKDIAIGYGLVEARKVNIDAPNGATGTTGLTITQLPGTQNDAHFIRMVDDAGQFRAGFSNVAGLRIGINGEDPLPASVKGVCALGGSAFWQISGARQSDVLPAKNAGSWTLWMSSDVIGIVSVLDDNPSTTQARFGFQLQSIGSGAAQPLAGLRWNNAVGSTSCGSLWLSRKDQAGFWDLSCNDGAVNASRLICSHNDAAISFLDATTKSWTAASDARLKENIDYAGVPGIEHLKPASFTWKDSPDTKMYGFIAQDIQAVHPSLVLDDGSDEHVLSLSQNQIIPMLVKTVQDQAKLITDLEARIAALETAQP